MKKIIYIILTAAVFGLLHAAFSDIEMCRIAGEGLAGTNYVKDGERFFVSHLSTNINLDGGISLIAFTNGGALFKADRPFSEAVISFIHTNGETNTIRLKRAYEHKFYLIGIGEYKSEFISNNPGLYKGVTNFFAKAKTANLSENNVNFFSGALAKRRYLSGFVSSIADSPSNIISLYLNCFILSNGEGTFLAANDSELFDGFAQTGSFFPLTNLIASVRTAAPRHIFVYLDGNTSVTGLDDGSLMGSASKNVRGLISRGLKGAGLSYSIISGGDESNGLLIKMTDYLKGRSYLDSSGHDGRLSSREFWTAIAGANESIPRDAAQSPLSVFEWAKASFVTTNMIVRRYEKIKTNAEYEYFTRNFITYRRRLRTNVIYKPVGWKEIAKKIHSAPYWH